MPNGWWYLHGNLGLRHLRQPFPRPAPGRMRGVRGRAAVAAVRAAGGLSFVTASHPHFYGAMAEWARVFGAEIGVPSGAWETVRRSALRYVEHLNGTA